MPVLKTIVGTTLLFIAGLIYALTNLPSLREQIGSAATVIVRPIVIPVLELINVPAFVYCASLAILLAGLSSCIWYRFAVVRPAISSYRHVHSAIRDLPEPTARPSDARGWPSVREQLGRVLLENLVFVSAWSLYKSETVRIGGIPHRPFSSFVASDPGETKREPDLMSSLPSYFTSVGLIMTFVGLVVALYYAAKGFRTGDILEARSAIIQLLNAASFKFLTSVSALISAFLISIYARVCHSAITQERLRTLDRIELFLGGWRDVVGDGKALNPLSFQDLLSRFDMLIAGVTALSSDVARLVLNRQDQVTVAEGGTPQGGLRNVGQ